MIGRLQKSDEHDAPERQRLTQRKAVGRGLEFVDISNLVAG